MLRRLLVVAPAPRGGPGPALRQGSATDTDELTVTATVLSACSLSGGTLNFGQYTSRASRPISTSPAPSTTSIAAAISPSRSTAAAAATSTPAR